VGDCSVMRWRRELSAGTTTPPDSLPCKPPREASKKKVHPDSADSTNPADFLPLHLMPPRTSSKRKWGNQGETISLRSPHVLLRDVDHSVRRQCAAWNRSAGSATSVESG
jgi:hypothetical protein